MSENIFALTVIWPQFKLTILDLYEVIRKMHIETAKICLTKKLLIEIVAYK